MSNTENFLKLRDEFCKKLEIVQKNAELTSWNFYINSTDENLEAYSKAQEDYYDLFQDKETYEKFKEIYDIGIDDKHLSKQLKKLVKEFEDEIKFGDELKVLRDLENEIAAKYNKHVMMIDNEPISNVEIIKILETETNVDLRQKAFFARTNCGNVIAKDLVNLVKKRNEWAKIKGYDNFFNYMIEDTYDITPQKLDELLNAVYEKTKDKCLEFTKRNQTDLAKSFEIEISELRDFHYGLLTEENPEKEVTKYIDNVVEIAENAYKNMGYDINNMGITLDLYPRPNKNTHGFAFCIEAGKDARILANLTDNISSLNTILHELGHCVYDIGINTELPFLDRDCASSAMTEAIAMLMGDLPKTENILSNIVPDNVLEKFKSELKKDEARFVARSLQIIEFEKGMYNNPNQDLKQLWKQVKQKYLFRSDNTEIDNSWATVPHYLSHPGYYQNYFRAALIKAQIYNTMREKLNGNISENNKTAEFLENNLFKIGASKDEDEIIKNITGKPLGVEDFCNRF